jgi:uncharacterized protein YkuJ
MMIARSFLRAAGSVAGLAAGIGFGAAGVVQAEVTYQYDDGVSNVTFGPPSSFEPFGDIDMLWGNYFFAEPGGMTITSIDFGLGELSPGGAVSLWVFDDPDDDADPTNAQPIFTVNTVGQNLGFDFNSVDITPTDVFGGFFVAVGHLAELDRSEGFAEYPAPARFDPDARADRSWFFYDDDIPENDLASSGFVGRMDGPQAPIPGGFAIRANAIPAPGAVGVLAFAGLCASRRRRA